MFRFLKKRIEDIESGEIFDEKGYKIKPNKLEEMMDRLEIALLQSDVALEVVDAIKNRVRSELLEEKIRKGVEPKQAVHMAIERAIRQVLTSSPLNFDDFIQKAQKPVVLMFVGVNGTGKTTAIAKIAHRLQKQKMSCVIAASDTFRAGAIEQLERHADALGVRLIKHRQGADPAAVAFDAINHARAREKDVVLIDTAGRMQTNRNLMDEMKKIKRVAEPDMVIFVGDALAGNDTVEQARKFNDAVGIDAAILTKIDADAKGGAALSIAYAVGKPIIFVSTGQEYEDFVPFDAEWMIRRMFG